MNTINVAVGDDVSVFVQISPNETFEYAGIVSRISDTELSMWTTDSPHDTYEVEREVDIPLAKILEVDVF